MKIQKKPPMNKTNNPQATKQTNKQDQRFLPFLIYHYRHTLAKTTLLSALDPGSALEP